MARDIFISYSRWNLEQVKAIKGEIEQATGTECWMDLNAIESGAAQFTQDIVDGINTCTVFLFMLSKESQASKFALRELNFAMKKAEADRTKHVVIVNIDNCELCDDFDLMYGLTDTIAWQDLSQKEKLLRDMSHWFGTKRKAEGETKNSDDKARSKGLKKTFGWFQKMKPVITSRPVKWGLVIAFVSIISLFFYAYKSRIVKRKDFSEGMSAVRNGFMKWGYENESRELVIPCQWKFAGSFSDGLALVQDDNCKYGFIDKSGKVVISCQWRSADQFSAGLAPVQDNNWKWGYIDRTGEVAIPYQWEDAKIFSEGLAAVKDNKWKWGYIDRTGEVVISCQWESCHSFSDGLAAVQDANGNWGYIDKTGTVVIPCQLKDAFDFREGIAWVNDAYGVFCRIDKTGRVIEEKAQVKEEDNEVE